MSMNGTHHYVSHSGVIKAGGPLGNIPFVRDQLLVGAIDGSHGIIKAHGNFMMKPTLILSAPFKKVRQSYLTRWRWREKEREREWKSHAK